MDAHNTFLHCDLDEEVYIQLPLEFSAIDKTKVCKLNKFTWFYMEDLRTLKYFLRIEVAHGPKENFLCQLKYCAFYIVSKISLLSKANDISHRVELSIDNDKMRNQKTFEQYQ
ncbi:hypothetical protein CR513_14860, partial [Mucuna pruriens]